MAATEEQRAVIEDFDRNVLLLARAGTGKTYTIANKIAEAIRRGFCRGEEVLCVTFTVKAAEELREDVDAFCGEKSGAEVCTIHGFCFSLVKAYGKMTGEFRDPSVADEVDAGETLASLLLSYAERGEYKAPDGSPLLPEKQLARVATAVKHRRNELGYGYFDRGGYGEAIADLFRDGSFDELFTVKKKGVRVTDYSFRELLRAKGERFFSDYASILRASDLLDYDDLIFAAKACLLREKSFTDRYKLVIVDEMQDTSLTEYEVLRSFFPAARVLMCGDDAQTIYGWRGSAPDEVIRDFKENFGAVVMRLTRNRRSTPALSYAGAYYLKKTFGTAEALGDPPTDGEKIPIVRCGDEEDEAAAVFRILEGLDCKPYEVCVMARSNRYIADICKKFEAINALLPPERRLRFFTADSDYQFYKKPVVKDFLAFLRLLVNPGDAPSFERVAEKYLPGIGRGRLRALRDYGKLGLSVSSFLAADTYVAGDPLHGLIKAYRENRVVVYDLETTGLDLSRDEAIQISGVKTGADGVTGRFDRFVLPLREISAAALRTHGYGKEDLVRLGALPPERALAEFAAFAEGCVLVGHNSASFDDFILRRQLGEKNIGCGFAGFADTRALCALFHPDFPDYRLSTLCEKFGVINARAHDAFADVEATEKCLRRLMAGDILPTEEARRRVVCGLTDCFSDFYADYRAQKALLASDDVYGLMGHIGKKYGVFTVNPRPEDRESARDLCRALKGEYGKETGIPEVRLAAFLAEASLSGSQMDVMIRKLGKIPVVTVHQSKGCEFPVVLLVGMNENEFPSYRARMDGNEEEEKRVFYVAITRATKKLIVTYPSLKKAGGNFYPRDPSPYLAKLPREFTEVVGSDEDLPTEK
ncbi:MAG: ATP-dependent helicase [Candidatus Borkfalkiaceae bacterium]|nr:ATP-dependent helicase [Christensenellaceae bacterium]